MGIIGVVIAGVSFFSGVKYDQSTTVVSTRGNANLMGQNAQFRMGSTTGQRGRGVMGGGAVGSIVSKDATSITVSTIGGGSKIVFTSQSTKVTKTIDGALGDLVAGKDVSVSGTPNPDGSINAELVQLRSDFATSTNR